MNIAEVRRVVGRIQASLFKNSNATSIGVLKSQFRGTGLQFREHQVYEPGDDVRFIDWKILAKMNTPYIKTFEEERNVEIAVIIDASDTMKMGYKGVSKLQACIELVCLLYLLAEQTKDMIHAIIITDDIVSVQKSSGERGIARLIKSLQKSHLMNEKGEVVLTPTEQDGEKNRDKRTKEVVKHLKKNREVVLLSDFNDFLEAGELKRILYKKNTHAFRVSSPVERSTKVPYLLYLNKDQPHFAKVKVSDQEGVDNMLNKKIKELSVSERYLEDFVRELSP